MMASSGCGAPPGEPDRALNVVHLEPPPAPGAVPKLVHAVDALRLDDPPEVVVVDRRIDPRLDPRVDGFGSRAGAAEAARAPTAAPMPAAAGPAAARIFAGLRASDERARRRARRSGACADVP